MREQGQGREQGQDKEQNIDKEQESFREIGSYTHDQNTRTNNPRVGLATHDKASDKVKTYKFDVHYSPTLDWAGKAENTSFDVPVSSIHIHETVIPQRVINRLLRVTPQTQAQQLSLFPDADPIQRMQEQMKAVEAYQHVDKWKNRLIAGDSLVIMNSLLQKEGMGGKVQMAYIDPPYGIKYGSNFQPFVNKRDVKDKSDDDLSAEPETIKAFRDTWELGIHSYLNYLRNRLLLVHELLTDSGSVFVQISDENVHLVRCLCDEIFGVENFVSQIPFRKKSMSLGAAYLESSHDYIVWYAKDKSQLKYRQLFMPKNVEGDGIWNMIELPDGTRRKLTREEINNHSLIKNRGKIFRLHDLYPAGFNENAVFAVNLNGKEFYPPKGKSWKTSECGMQRLIEHRRIIEVSNRLHHVLYLDDYNVSPIMDMWSEAAPPIDKVYAVQTARLPIQRCMLMTTDPNDLVLDITCGSGTTAYVAEQWGRRWITCDTSRIAIAIARQRLLTAVYDYYELKDKNQGVAGGFNYKTVPHITLKSIANDEKPGEEILYDQPKIDRGKVRVSGPFNVEALPAPVVFSPDEAANFEPDPSEAAKHSDWAEQMKVTGINGTHGEKLNFTSIELFPGTKWINAEAYTDEGKHAFISFANEYVLMDTRRVYETHKEAMKFPHDMLIFAAFQFDPVAVETIEELKKRSNTVEILQVNMNTDLLTQDLRKKAKTDSLFWLVGQPDVSLEKVKKDEKDKENLYRVKILGFDYYNVSEGKVISGNTDKIAMWLLDTDYNGMELNPVQVFFPMEGKSGGWNKLAKTLRAEINQDLIEAFTGTESLEFEAKLDQKIAVKIIDDRGIESLRVLTVEEANL